MSQIKKEEVREEVIERLILGDLKEIKANVDGSNLRHFLYEGCKGYVNWSDEELIKEFIGRFTETDYQDLLNELN